MKRVTQGLATALLLASVAQSASALTFPNLFSRSFSLSGTGCFGSSCGRDPIGNLGAFFDDDDDYTPHSSVTETAPLSSIAAVMSSAPAPVTSAAAVVVPQERVEEAPVQAVASTPLPGPWILLGVAIAWLFAFGRRTRRAAG